jgi:hypothetical protein
MPFQCRVTVLNPRDRSTSQIVCPVEHRTLDAAYNCRFCDKHQNPGGSWQIHNGFTVVASNEWPEWVDDEGKHDVIEWTHRKFRNPQNCEDRWLTERITFRLNDGQQADNLLQITQYYATFEEAQRRLFALPRGYAHGYAHALHSMAGKPEMMADFAKKIDECAERKDCNDLIALGNVTIGPWGRH